MVAQSEFNLTIEKMGGPALLVEVKPGPRFSWWKMNKAAEEYLGITLEDVPGGPALENFEGLNPAQIKQRKEALLNIRRCFITEGPVTWDFNHLRPDGSDLWGRYTIVPIFGDGGEIHQLLLTSIDITELIETQKEMQTVIESFGAPMVIIDVGPDERFTYRFFNSSAEQFFDVKNDELAGCALGDFAGVDEFRIANRKRTITLCKRCVATKASLAAEYEQQQPGGSRWARMTMVPIFDTAGEVKQIMITALDITELVETQKEMQIVIESFGAPMLIIDVRPDERFTWNCFNPSAERFYGVKNDEMAGRDVDDFEGVDEFRIAIRKRTMTLCKRCVATKAPLSAEEEYPLPGGHRWARNMVVPIFDAAGEVKQIMSTALDITELMETRKRLEDSQKRLEEALTKTLSGFLTICSYCKNIKDDEQQWQPIEKYAAKHMNIHEFSHGMCPTCYEREIQDLDP